MNAWLKRDAQDTEAKWEAGKDRGTGDEAGRQTPRRLWIGAQPARLHPAAIDELPDPARVFRYTSMQMVEKK